MNEQCEKRKVQENQKIWPTCETREKCGHPTSTRKNVASAQKQQCDQLDDTIFYRSRSPANDKETYIITYKKNRKLKILMQNDFSTVDENVFFFFFKCHWNRFDVTGIKGKRVTGLTLSPQWLHRIVLSVLHFFFIIAREKRITIKQKKNSPFRGQSPKWQNGSPEIFVLVIGSRDNSPTKINPLTYRYMFAYSLNVKKAKFYACDQIFCISYSMYTFSSTTVALLIIICTVQGKCCSFSFSTLL